VKSNDIDIYNFELRMWPLFKWIGLIVSALFGLFILLMTLFPSETVTLGVYFTFSTFFLFGLFMILYSVRKKIQVSENSIICYSLFRSPRQYTFEMVKKIVVNDSNNGRDVIVYGHDEKIFSFSSAYEGFNLLMLRFGEKQILTEYRQVQTVNNRTINEHMNPDIKPRSSLLSIIAVVIVIVGGLCNLLGVAGIIPILRNIGILICVAAIIISVVDFAKSGSYKPPQKSDFSLLAIILGILVCFMNGIIYL